MLLLISYILSFNIVYMLYKYFYNSNNSNNYCNTLIPVKQILAKPKPYIIKLQLRGKQYKNKCIDNNITNLLHYVAKELMIEFHVQTTMVYNNEIMLIFSNNNIDNDNELFKGDYNKLISIIPSYAASILSMKLNNKCSFNATMICFDSINEMTDNVKLHSIKMRMNKVIVYIIKRTYNMTEYKYIKFTIDKLSNKFIQNTNLFTSSIFNIKYLYNTEHIIIN